MSNVRPIVAVVDDDPRLLESLEELLESAGYAVRSFSSARQLLISGLSGLDVLITDIGMLGINGFELRDLVKRTRPELPVFFITGRHEIADQERAQGVSGLFRKPFDALALLGAVGDVLRNQRVEDDHDR
ncbi:MAG: response regulator [Mesorhizobium sp.]|uniref:response regulator n=1 Tax=Mesorhizobium sp. TaxID=1871066 RepID=UPI000FE98CC1|nr:response regulator [Mesorhizobium sp.]RWD67031.1 MAG: response regulator [Mesorhizobium sp.]RWE38569.1 MAG: response regulator [Mesorhizobium sp.]TIW00936.1 MAG: response regulator [Mesorhizobium sp.]